MWDKLEEVLEACRVDRGCIIQPEDAKKILRGEEPPHYVTEWHRELLVAHWVAGGQEWPLAPTNDELDTETDDSDKPDGPGTIGQDITDGNPGE